jgi:hypothetical protein
MAEGFNPSPAPSPGGPTGNSTSPSTPSEGVSEGVGGAIQGAEQIANTIISNPTLLLAVIAGVVVLYMLFKKIDDRAVSSEYDAKDWSDLIPSDIKYIVHKGGLDTDKELTRGDFTNLGEVHKHDTFSMPKENEYKELLFDQDGELEDLDQDDFKDVYVFLVSPTGFIGKEVWKITDIYFNLNLSTQIFVVDADSVEEEQGRFKLNEAIDFKREYGNIMMEKGVATENVTDQFPLYQARKNIVEGIEEFTMKTLFLDRQHSTAIAQMREDVDEEALKKFLNQGKNF